MAVQPVHRQTVLQSRPLPLRARMEADTDSSRDVFEVRGGLLAQQLARR